LACQISLDAVQTVMIDENGRREIDIKRYARFEKVCDLINKFGNFFFS
jgi:T-complex protein 1 subunit gamma